VTIDAHVHLWRLSRGDNVVLNPSMKAIYMDRLPTDLKPRIDAAEVERVVVVQAAETLAESLFTIGLARKFTWIAGIVAWVELASPAVEEEIATLSWNPLVKGVRPVRDDNRSIAWMLDKRLERGLRTLQDSSLSFDVLVQDWREIPLAIRLAERWPGLAFVLDHCGKPDVANHVFEPWARHIDELASLPNVMCKLSGLLNCARSGASAPDLEIYANHVLGTFSPSRVMWASDWPPLDLASDYATWKRISERIFQRLPIIERNAVMAGTAMRIYRLGS
jgi:L-fuconolactonase